jgi:hypothetical protein
MMGNVMQGVVERLAAVVPWPVEQADARIRCGDRVRVQSAEWAATPVGTVTDVWTTEQTTGEGPTRLARVELDGLDEAISFPVDELVRRA